MTPNLVAFLTMISHSEGTDRAPDPYRVCFGYKHTIQDLNYHPAEMRPPDNEREWTGESLATLGGSYIGKFSTAAGRYQIIKSTWLACKAELRLPDFTGPSQDAAAALLIKQGGAMDYVNAGQIGNAIDACRSIWASLPGSDSGQPQATFAALMTAYSAAGGAFA